MLFECVHVIHFSEGFITVISLTYSLFFLIYFLSQNASHNMTSFIQLIFFIGSSNAKHYYHQPYLKKMRLVQSCIETIVGRILLTPGFVFVTSQLVQFFLICTFFVPSVIMGFQQMSAETRGMIVVCCQRAHIVSISLVSHCSLV